MFLFKKIRQYSKMNYYNMVNLNNMNITALKIKSHIKMIFLDLITIIARLTSEWIRNTISLGAKSIL
jgi:hypothetical protein